MKRIEFIKRTGEIIDSRPYLHTEPMNGLMEILIDYDIPYDIFELDDYRIRIEIYDMDFEEFYLDFSPFVSNSIINTINILIALCQKRS